ncbi:hypothetical protein ZIOFF_075276 [Zingiber officinale]|uniref:E3 ubiquitin-protein ligase RNF123/RKP TPR repeat domain-containing protein n=1 Tax=Zingiber officinale TaxID=94328 RepID=A0A8J5B979_ZINOF|nr:hypothetical protein ZIOFF_075276 [Zingiber officinale]
MINHGNGTNEKLEERELLRSLKSRLQREAQGKDEKLNHDEFDKIFMVTFVVRHFNDPRILSADIKDLLLHSISSLVQCKDYLIAFENNKEAIHSLPKALLLAFDNRSWIPVTNIILRLCKGSGFGASKHLESSSSAHFQVLLREACCSDETLFSSFLNRLFNTLSWTMTEFSVSIREMQENCQVSKEDYLGCYEGFGFSSLVIPSIFESDVGDLQQRRCGVVFDLSCSLARLLEFCTREIPQVFLLGPDMNLRRLIELIIFILNHIISASDAEFFDIIVPVPVGNLRRRNCRCDVSGLLTAFPSPPSDGSRRRPLEAAGVAAGGGGRRKAEAAMTAADGGGCDSGEVRWRQRRRLLEVMAVVTAADGGGCDNGDGR